MSQMQQWGVVNPIRYNSEIDIYKENKIINIYFKISRYDTWDKLRWQAHIKKKREELGI